MFSRIYLVACPRLSAVRLPLVESGVHLGPVLGTKSLIRQLYTASVLCDFNRSNAESFRSKSAGQHEFNIAHLNSPRKSRNADDIVVSDFSSLKSPFSCTESAPLDWENIPELTIALKRAMSEVFKYKSCTPVQAAIASKMPLKNDLVVQAKTGTGKTLAFLVPAVNRVLMTENLQSSGQTTKILIISPTRELALQIGKEAERLVSKCRLGVHTLVGGDSKLRQARDMMRRRCDIIIGTPGRLIDFITTDGRFRDALKGVQSLILDEADRMLEIGFKEDIVSISNALPDFRHTMLFSATYPKNVEQLVKSTLKPGFEVINTISDNDVSTVHAIDQTYLIAPLIEQPYLLHSALSRAMKTSSFESPFKAIVFFPTTRTVELYAELFRNLKTVSVPGSITFPRENLFELHARKTQASRMKIADRFRAARSGVLFTTDVSARGVDYPGCQLVVQMGMPMSRDQYVHRIGRTGRAGKSGSALTILSPFEKSFFDGLSELPIRLAEKGENGEMIIGLGDSVPWDDQANRTAINSASKELDQESLGNAYVGSLGFYQGQLDTLRGSGYTANKVMLEMQDFYQSLGLEYIPNLPSALRGTFAVSRPSQTRSGTRSYDRQPTGFRSFSRRGDSFKDFGGNNYSKDYNRTNSRDHVPRQFPRSSERRY